MRVLLAVAVLTLMVFYTSSAAVAASEEEIDTFVEKEAYIIADKLKLRDLDKTKTVVRITAHRMDSNGIQWLSGDVKIYSEKYGLCAVALQLKFIEENNEVLVVSSKGVLGALDINKGVEKYRGKLREYKRSVQSSGHAIIIPNE